MNVLILRIILASQVIVCGLIGTVISFTFQTETGAMVIGILWLLTLSILSVGNLLLDNLSIKTPITTQ